jgi:hypothetical protein
MIFNRNLKIAFIISIGVLIIYCNTNESNQKGDQENKCNCSDTLISSAFLIDFSSEIVHIIPTKFIYLEDIKGCFRSDNFGIGFLQYSVDLTEVINNNGSVLNFHEFIHKDLNFMVDNKIKIAPVKIKFIEPSIKWVYQNEGVRRYYECFSFNLNIPEIRKEPIITILDTRPVKVLEIAPFKY